MFIKDVLILIKELKIKGSKGDRVATELTKLVFKEKKTSLLSDPQKAQNLNMIFFSSEPCKQT
jgi:hypothetical protein